MSEMLVCLSEPASLPIRAKKVGKLLPSHRSTAYPCSVPSLGDSAGAGRERLTRGKSRYIFYYLSIFTKIVNARCRNI